MGATGNDQKPVPDFGLGTQRLYERMDSCARRTHERQHEPQRTCRLVSHRSISRCTERSHQTKRTGRVVRSAQVSMAAERAATL